MYSKYHIVIATSRPVESQVARIEWLNKNFEYHEFANTRQVGKANLGLNVLIDDNLDNAKIVAAREDAAILFSQRWNEAEDQETKLLVANRKLIRCHGWDEVAEQVGKLYSIFLMQTGFVSK